MLYYKEILSIDAVIVVRIAAPEARYLKSVRAIFHRYRARDSEHVIGLEPPLVLAGLGNGQGEVAVLVGSDVGVQRCISTGREKAHQ